MSKGKPEFTFYDGPPFATGLPHYGHIAAGTIKVSLTQKRSVFGLIINR
jgi:isoleucyl-tRNA synthetase